MKYQDINIKIFWKVHINNFDRFIKYVYSTYELNNIEKFNHTERVNHFKPKYVDKSYLYFCIGDFLGDNKLNLSCIECENMVYNWFITNNYVYEDEFDSRKKKLTRLKKISK